MKKILIVDDDPMTLQLLKLQLESTKTYQVFTESKGLLAVDAARKYQPDLVLLDILMPDLLGSEVAASLHEDSALSHIKVVFITSMMTHDAEQHSGEDITIGKPASTEELVSVIDQVLGKDYTYPEFVFNQTANVPE
ncbi:MAG: response regulator [Sulfuritalea sp.]|nr:response regulator [Sulfuritalea sp.]